VTATPVTYVFTGDLDSTLNTVDISANNPANAGDFWMVRMGAPRGEALRTGTYRDARRVPPLSTALPMLSIAGQGRACNQSTGEFEVKELVIGERVATTSFLPIDRLRATFTQRCDENPSGVLTGEVIVATTQNYCKYSKNC
jgi:hypothetical protein